MALEYTQPEPSLARELREVARDASALQDALTTGLNFELPPDFPRDQLIDITRSLARLPNGTAEGCHAALEYARNRLPAIRREHILSEELDPAAGITDAAPSVVRGELIDERLRHLIASATTALDEYRRLAAEEPAEEAEPEAEVTAPGEVIEGAVTQSERLEQGLDEAASTVAESTNPHSHLADDLKRQINDGQSLNRLARTELRMPKIVVSWYRLTIEALKEYPSLIRNTADALRLGTDILENVLERWHEFKRSASQFLIDEFRKTLDAADAVAGKLEERRRRRTIGPATPEGDFDFEVARAMILSGRLPPTHWLPSITSLRFGIRRISNLTVLAGLTHLRYLTHVSVHVHDLTPLAGLASLENLNLSGIHATNIAPLAALKALRHLDLWGAWVSDMRPLATLTDLLTLNLGSTRVRDITPLAALSKLQALDLTHTNVAKVAPLASLVSLQRLRLDHTPINDVTPLAALINLQHLDLSDTSVSDVAPLAALTGLQELDLRRTPVTDLAPLGSLTNLKEINLSGSKVSDVAALATLTSLRRLNLIGTEVKSVAPLEHLKGLTIQGVPR